MLSLAHATEVGPGLRPTKYLARKPLCGLCRFKCCNSPSLEVETTEEEAGRLNLPRRFPQAGRCRCLGPAGCVHGEARPVFCKMFPLQVRPDGALIVSYWSTLNCPTAADYELVGRDGELYVYRRKLVGASKAANSQEELRLDRPIEDMPTALDIGAPALDEVFGAGTADRMGVHTKKGLVY